MDKIFLSHSSEDKKYVSYIAKQFGKDQCVYDEMCFEFGMKNLDEIFREMDSTGIFVIFISNNSLNSVWVQTELKIAEERLGHNTYKLSKIFPIIIDPQITHCDERIPEFLKMGFDSYNLRPITSNIVAYRKIKAQQIKRLMSTSLDYKSKYCVFYGRDNEIARFKSRFDSGNNINCFIASGIYGIGRRSYVIKCLREAKIIKDYYEPAIISLDHLSSIEDLIAKFSEVGFGTYSIDKVVALGSMQEKTLALIDVLSEVQNLKEHVIIYDNSSLINYHGELIYWLTNALKEIRQEITISIVAKNKVSNSFMRSNPFVFSIELSALPYTEWMGLMRVYSQSIDLDLSLNDREYFRDILTGYPPQAIHCVNMMKDNSIDYVKKHPEELIDKFSPRVTQILNSAIPEDISEAAYGFLSFMSSYGVVPTALVNDIISINIDYKTIYRTFKSLTIFRFLGIANEYIEVNPVISDYIQRNRFKLPVDIKKKLKDKLDQFNANINDPSFTEYEDFESIKFYLKENLINGTEIPDRFMYSTLYLTCVYELYNNQKYKQVISIVKKLKETGVFSRYDRLIQARIQGFYCRALARELEEEFYTEVEFFTSQEDVKDTNEYNFLRGFMFRHSGSFDKALERYQKVLDKHSKHRSAMREIVVVYRGLEDHESAYEYAKVNYLRDLENPYQIQPYFEILVRKKASDRSDEENDHIDEICKTMKRINDSMPSTAYYEILAQHAAYIEKDQVRSISILNEGHKKYPESSYIIKSLFDCYEYFKDLKGMISSLSQLEQFAADNKSVHVAFSIRNALLSAYQGKPKNYIENMINNIKGLNMETKARLCKRVANILDQN